MTIHRIAVLALAVLAAATVSSSAFAAQGTQEWLETNATATCIAGFALPGTSFYQAPTFTAYGGNPVPPAGWTSHISADGLIVWMCGPQTSFTNPPTAVSWMMYYNYEQTASFDFVAFDGNVVTDAARLTSNSQWPGTPVYNTGWDFGVADDYRNPCEVPVPEPMSMALAGLGLSAVASIRRKRA